MKTTNRKMTLRRAATALLLCVLTTVSAWADNVTYIDADGIERTVDATPLATKNGSDWYLTNTTLNAGQWYYVNSDYRISGNSRITVSGSGAAKIILCDGKIFSYGSRGITGNITIYGQSAGTGKMEIFGSNTSAYEYDNTFDGELTIYGGKVTIEGGLGRIGIEEVWRSRGAIGGTVNMYGGSLTATVEDAYDSLWPYGTDAINATVNFYGGTLSATGGRNYGYFDDDYNWIENGADPGVGIIGDVNLSWTWGSDSFYANSINGTVTIAADKPFKDEQGNSHTSANVGDIIGHTLTPDIPAFADSGDGSAEHPYTIYEANGWNAFCDALQDNDTWNHFSGKTVKLGDNISVTQSAGGEGHEFMGTFDGDGKTLTVNITDTENQGTAPFRFISNATIRNLHVTGSVTGTAHAAGLVGKASAGTILIENCLVEANVNSTVDDTNGNRHCGGIVGHGYGGNSPVNLTLRNCVYTGTITCDKNYIGGLQGWSDGNTLTLENCLFAGNYQGTATGTAAFHPIALHNTGKTTNLTATNVFTAVAPTVTNTAFIAANGTKTTGRATVPAGIGNEVATYDYMNTTVYEHGILYNGLYYVAPTLSTDSDNAYLINNEDDWTNFCDALYDNGTWNRFTGKTVKLGADISVSRMAGVDYHDFTGTFDGQGKTLTFTATATDNYLAPFCNVLGNSSDDHAVIRNLNVVTKITANDYRHTAGLMAKVWGYVDVVNCNITANITATKGNQTELYPAGLVSQVTGSTQLTVSGCTVGGTITTDGKYAGGMVGIVQGSASIENSMSSVTIDSSVSGDATHGGFVAVLNSDCTLNIEGCVFNGKIVSTNGTTNCGGFLGHNNKQGGTGATITNCLYAPTADANTVSEGCATFGRNVNSDLITNCYYTAALGETQGKQAHAITAGANVTVSNIALTGTETEYSVSGITAYSGGGLALDDGNETTLYYGSDDQVSLTLANTPPEGYGLDSYTASPDEARLTEDGDNYTLTMPDADVTVNAIWTAETYTINYNLDGGHLPTGQSNPATYTVETETFTLVNPERDGYAFAGWTGTGLNGATKTVTITQGTTTGNRDYTATWTLLPVSYIDADGIERTVVATPLAYKGKWGYWNLTTTTLTAGQWYYVNSDYGISDDDRITVSGSGAANIILCDGKIFRYDSMGITGNITIYGQSAGTGKLIICGRNSDRENYENTFQGVLTIYGGIVSIEGGPGENSEGRGFWYSRGAIGGTVNMYGGSLTAKGAQGVSSSGTWLNGTNAINATVNFYGGTLSATGGEASSDPFYDDEMNEYVTGSAGVGINGTVNLSWDRSSDRFYADSYNGTVNVADGYTFLTNNNATVSGNGISGSTLNGKTLRPDTNSALHDDGDNRYTILTGAGWNLFCNMVKDGETFSGKTVYLGNDITASNIAGNATHQFCGEFDGLGNTVSGLNVYRGGTDPNVDSYVGLFACLGSGANVHHVNQANSSFTGRNYIGGIAGRQEGGTVSYCTVASTVSINDAVIGTNQAPNNYHGGIVGYLYNGTVSHCVSSATLTVVDASSNSQGYGAIVGLIVNGSITDNLAIGATMPSSAKSSMAVIVGNRFGGGLQRNYYTNCTVRGVANATGVGHFDTWAEPNLSDLTANDGAVPALRDGADNSTALALMAAVPEKFGTYSVSLNGRTLYKDGDWNTLCLPFDVTVGSGQMEGATAMTLNGSTSGFDSESGVLTLNFDNVTEGNTIAAGTPFIIKWDGDGTNNLVNPVFTNVSVISGDPTSAQSTKNDVAFTGSYSPAAIAVGNKACLFLGIGKNDQDEDVSTLYYPDASNYGNFPNLTGATADNYYLGAFRAYFKVNLGDGLGVYPAPDAVRQFVLNFGDETGIGHTEITEITEKAGGWYTLDGVKLNGKPTCKGLYIHGGKKVVVP